jgi:hypothetical protein
MRRSTHSCRGWARRAVELPGWTRLTVGGPEEAVVVAAAEETALGRRGRAHRREEGADVSSLCLLLIILLERNTDVPTLRSLVADQGGYR